MAACWLRSSIKFPFRILLQSALSCRTRGVAMQSLSHNADEVCFSFQGSALGKGREGWGGGLLQWMWEGKFVWFEMNNSHNIHWTVTRNARLPFSLYTINVTSLCQTLPEKLDLRPQKFKDFTMKKKYFILNVMLIMGHEINHKYLSHLEWAELHRSPG